MDMQLDGNFYEADESTEELLAAFDAGQPTTLTPPDVPILRIVELRELTGFPPVERVPTYGAGPLVVRWLDPVSVTVSPPPTSPIQA